MVHEIEPAQVGAPPAMDRDSDVGLRLRDPAQRRHERLEEGQVSRCPGPADRHGVIRGRAILRVPYVGVDRHGQDLDARGACIPLIPGDHAVGGDAEVGGTDDGTQPAANPRARQPIVVLAGPQPDAVVRVIDQGSGVLANLACLRGREQGLLPQDEVVVVQPVEVLEAFRDRMIDRHSALAQGV